jgi:AcrR family transcriptional regulator
MGRNKTVEDEQVLAAARTVFRLEGHAASTRDVARAAGISQAVLYQRFGSKEELFFRAMTPEAFDVDALLGAYPPRSARADLIAIGERLLAYLRTFAPTLLSVLAAHGSDVDRLRTWHGQLPFLPIHDALSARFRQMMADGLIGGGDSRARALAFIAAIHSLSMIELLVAPAERKTRKANVQALVDALWHGFSPR